MGLGDEICDCDSVLDICACSRCRCRYMLFAFSRAVLFKVLSGQRQRSELGQYPIDCSVAA